ncbi:MAG: invasion associated locus B family protein [Pseudomonadota bacterium]
MTRVSGLLVASLVAVCPVATLSEPVVGQKFGDWTFECVARSQNSADCSLTQVVTANETQNPVAQFRISAPKADRPGFMSVLIPLGTNLRDGLEASFDNGVPMPFVPYTCTKNGCLLIAPVSEAVAESLRAQNALDLAFSITNTNRRYAVKSSLKGLTKAFEETKWFDGATFNVAPTPESGTD